MFFVIWLLVFDCVINYLTPESHVWSGKLAFALYIVSYKYGEIFTSTYGKKKRNIKFESTLNCSKI